MSFLYLLSYTSSSYTLWDSYFEKHFTAYKPIRQNILKSTLDSISA